MQTDLIKINQCFQAQYVLEIATDAMFINAAMKSRTELRYDFSVLKVREADFDCRLVQLDIFIKEANNSLVTEVAELTGVFNRMFNELHLRISHTGIVLEVINIDLILSKWEQTKELMQQAANKSGDLKELISLNDSVFTNAEKIKSAIQANEFIQCYFGNIYGVVLPYKKQDSSRTNFFNTSYLPFVIAAKFLQTENPNGQLIVQTSAMPAVVLDKAFCKNAYKSFEDKLAITSLQPKIKEEATHIIENSTGKVLNAKIVKEEQVTDNLYTNTIFDLVFEDFKPTNKESENVFVESDVLSPKSKFKFFS